MRPLSTGLAGLYEGSTDRAHRFRYGLLVFDIGTVIWVVATSFLPRHAWIEGVDVGLGLVVLLDRGEGAVEAETGPDSGLMAEMVVGGKKLGWHFGPRAGVRRLDAWVACAPEFRGAKDSLCVSSESSSGRDSLFPGRGPGARTWDHARNRWRRT